MTIAAAWVRTLDSGAEELIFCSDSRLSNGKRPVSVSNSTEKIIKYTLSMTTVASETKIPSYNRHLSDVIVIPGKTEERKISVTIPAKSENIAERTIFIEISFESMEGNESLMGLTQKYVYK